MHVHCIHGAEQQSICHNCNATPNGEHGVRTTHQYVESLLIIINELKLFLVLIFISLLFFGFDVHSKYLRRKKNCSYCIIITFFLSLSLSNSLVSALSVQCLSFEHHKQKQRQQSTFSFCLLSTSYFGSKELVFV